MKTAAGTFPHANNASYVRKMALNDSTEKRYGEFVSSLHANCCFSPLHTRMDPGSRQIRPIRGNQQLS